MNIDWKHIVAAVVGLILGIVGSYYGIDFSSSIPKTEAPAAVVSPVQK